MSLSLRASSCPRLRCITGCNVIEQLLAQSTIVMNGAGLGHLALDRVV